MVDFMTEFTLIAWIALSIYLLTITVDGYINGYKITHISWYKAIGWIAPIMMFISFILIYLRS